MPVKLISDIDSTEPKFELFGLICKWPGPVNVVLFKKDCGLSFVILRYPAFTVVGPV